jgi:transcriptional regulator with XRE-family HTH domain
MNYRSWLSKCQVNILPGEVLLWQNFTMVNKDFIDLIESAMAKKNMNRAKLAKRAHISQSTLSEIWHGKKKPGLDVCTAIAPHLGLDEVEVLRAAHLIRPKPPKDESAEKVLDQYLQLPLSKREQVAETIGMYYEKYGPASVEEATQPER